MAHRVYIKGIEGIVNNLVNKFPQLVEKHMKVGTKNCGELLKKRILEKIGTSHQHPAGTPPAGLGLGENKSWYPPASKRKRFGHEAIEGPTIPVGQAPGDYDFTVQAPTEHWWPFRRTGELAGSIDVIQVQGTAVGTFAFALFAIDRVPDDLETREGGKYSFVIPTIFQEWKSLFMQFVRSGKDLMNENLSVS